ncbi:MAG: type I secretion system permease/ATPase [Pseudomonadota bacterium]
MAAQILHRVPSNKPGDEMQGEAAGLVEAETPARLEAPAKPPNVGGSGAGPRGPAGEDGRVHCMRDALRRCGDLITFALIASIALNLLMLAGPLYMLQVYDRVLTSQSAETLIAITLLLVAAYLAWTLIDIARTAVMGRVGLRMDRLVGETLVRGAWTLPGRYGPSQSIENVQDLETVRKFTASPGLIAWADLPFTPLFVAVIYLIHPLLAVFAAGAVLLLIALTAAANWATKDRLDDARELNRANQRELGGVARSAETVRALGMIDRLVLRWREGRVASLREETLGTDRSTEFKSTTKGVRFLVQSLILGLGAYLVLQGEMSPGGMIAASIILGRALAPIEAALAGWAAFGGAKAAYLSLDEALKLRRDAELQRTQLPRLRGRLDVANVVYAPLGFQKPILTNVSFTAEPGDFVGVLGQSGAGKSTLARMLVGALEPTTGEVRYDGARIDLYEPDTLGEQIGYLPQDIQLVDGTVAENIARFRPGQDEAVVAAAQTAGLHELILSLPQGYDTPIGEHGRALSVGQKQRLALARALFGDPRVFILDEPNSNLDDAGEAALARVVADLRKRGRTGLIVTHRRSVIRHVNKLLILHEGRVALYGPTEEVVAQLNQRDAERKGGASAGKTPAAGEAAVVKAGVKKSAAKARGQASGQTTGQGKARKAAGPLQKGAGAKPNRPSGPNGAGETQ